MSKLYLRFTDHEGDPLALTNEVSAVYLTSDKETVQATTFPGQTLTKVKVSEVFTVINHSTGQYRVRDSFDDVMAKLDMANELQDMERKDGYL